MPLIGTAGHVDHGKSTLIERITGRDPDRWEEEKRRGLTIDLGFAWTELEDGVEVSFVDVPGHERFLKNMLAGIEAIDVALFVVAADEGWMPQSEEHLAILDLLEVSSGVVALTKTDTVDDDLIELAALEVSDRLAGTTLEDARVIPVSARTGRGVDRLVEELGRLASATQVPDRGRPRLWVDRSFTASGAGTVVTGTLLDGSFDVGDPVAIYPHVLESRIRGIQSHEHVVQRVEPGRRVALNLAGIDHTDVTRGDMVGRPGEWESSSRVSVSLSAARYVDELDRRGAYQIHTGSAVDRVEIVALDEGVALLKLDRSRPMTVGDRFVIRDTGRRLVVGGGRILDPAPTRTMRALDDSRHIDPGIDPDGAATALLEIRGIDSLARLARQTGGGTPEGAMIVGDWAMSPDRQQLLGEEALALVEEEHAAHPLRTGLPIATLAGHLGIEPDLAEAIVETSPGLHREGPDVSVVGREIDITAGAAAEWEEARSALGESLAVPTVGELGLDPELLHLKIRAGELVRVSPDLVFLTTQIDQLLEVLESLPEDFTVAQFRDAAGLSRKYAVPILEWSDREGITIRTGDKRKVHRAQR